MEDQNESVMKEMEETRSSLTEKLEALETKMADKVAPVAEAVQRATEATAHLVEEVKEKVHAVTEKVENTVESVASALDVRRHYDEHPWFMLALATTAGCVLGNLTAPRREIPRTPPPPEPPPTPQPARPKHAKSHSNGWARKKEETPSVFTEELQRLKALAIGTLMGAVREMAKRSLPEGVADRVAEEVDRFTTQLGVEPIRGSVLGESTMGRPSATPNAMDEKDSSNSSGDAVRTGPEVNRMRSRGAGSDLN
jgi:ElaB/YqjD/DUF883 family membrane-anchored ribosome-binding protein